MIGGEGGVRRYTGRGEIGGERGGRGEPTSDPNCSELGCRSNKCSVLEWPEEEDEEEEEEEARLNLLLLSPWENLTVLLRDRSTGCMQVGQVKDRMSQSSMQRMW